MSKKELLIIELKMSKGMISELVKEIAEEVIQEEKFKSDNKNWKTCFECGGMKNYNGKMFKICECQEEVKLDAEEGLIIKNYCQTMYGKSWKRHIFNIRIKVIRMIERYGEDGFGNKPPEMNRVEYWLGHITD